MATVSSRTVDLAAAELVERKICEGFNCGAGFYRPVPVHASLGEKLCGACRQREAQVSAAQTSIMTQMKSAKLREASWRRQADRFARAS